MKNPELDNATVNEILNNIDYFESESFLKEVESEKIKLKKLKDEKNKPLLEIKLPKELTENQKIVLAAERYHKNKQKKK